MFDPEQLAVMQQQVAEACMQIRELIVPVLESAEGVKADLVARGWSQANAEGVAAHYAQATLRTALGGGA